MVVAQQEGIIIMHRGWQCPLLSMTAKSPFIDLTHASFNNYYVHYLHFIRQYNGLALCWKIGHPLFFITFTCNPKWPEITSLLLPGQTASDRPDLTGRVFELELKALLKRLSEGMSVFMSVFHCACSHSAILARTAACPRPFDPTSPDCPLEPAQFTGLASTGSCRDLRQFVVVPVWGPADA